MPLKAETTAKLIDIKRRNSDLFQTCAGEIKTGKFLHISPDVVKETKLLLDLVERAYGVIVVPLPEETEPELFEEESAAETPKLKGKKPGKKVAAAVAAEL